MAPTPRLEVVRALGPADARRVLDLAHAATAADGVAPLSEHVVLHVRAGGEEPGRHLLLVDDTEAGQPLAGYAHLDPTDAVEGPSAELVVAPGRRRRGLGTALLAALERESPAPPRVWAHGALGPARSLAAALGYEVTRELLQLRLPAAAPLPPAEVPPGVRVRTWTDDDAYELLELNAAAFAHHPEQGGWTAADLATRLAEPWFDPAGLFLAEEDTEDAAGPPPLLAFHWTKVHGEHDAGHDGEHDGERPPDADGHGHGLLGEVYVLGVHPRAQGRGLGRTMTLVGLHHLRGLGIGEVMLYVEAGNAAAVRTYTGLGFRRAGVDVQFRKPPHG